MQDVRGQLLKAGLMILRDECPPPTYYYCSKSEFYDDTVCERCWTNFLFDVANGKFTGEMK